MGYILEFRDESHHEEMMEKLHKAKKAVCEAMEMLEEAGYNERRGRRGMSYKDDYDDERMMSRHGRYSY